MTVINYSLTLYKFFIDTETKSPYPLTSSTHLPLTFSSFLSGSIVTLTPPTKGKRTLN